MTQTFEVEGGEIGGEGEGIVRYSFEVGMYQTTREAMTQHYILPTVYFLGNKEGTRTKRTIHFSSMCRAGMRLT